MKIKEQILLQIKKYERIIIHRHGHPDPDAIGSQCGLAACLRASFPKKEIFQVGGPVAGLDYLAEMEEIADQVYEGALVIVTDTANAPRISDQRYNLGACLIKIDHHPNDEPYGDLQWVNTAASSCSEMIFDFYAAFQNELTLPPAAARLLYAGIVGDTGRFLYPATTSHTFEVAAALLRYPFNASALCRKLDTISFSVAQLSAYVYQNLELDESGAGRVLLPQSVLDKYHVVDSETAAIVPLPGQIEDVLLWGIFVAQPEGYYRVRLRSKGPVINHLAKAHHGGGHPLASGANAQDTKEIEQIYQEMKEIARKYRREN